MTDDPRPNASPDGQPPIDRSDPAAMRCWSDRLGADQVELLVAIAAVGPEHRAVQAYLERPGGPSHRPDADLPVGSVS